MTSPSVPVRLPPVGDVVGQLRSTRVLDVVPRVTLLLVVATADPTSTGVVISAVLLAVVILFPSLYRSPLVWVALTGLVLARYLPDWEGVDNHDWLLVYWCAALACALLSTEPVAVLRTQARLLAGLVFALAVAWKLRSGQYVDGSFFEHALLADPRLEPVARWVGGLSDAEYAANASLLGDLVSGAPAVSLVTTERLRAAAFVMTWSALLLETAAAVCFLAPPASRLGRLRHAMVFVFCVTTYLVVPVIGFGVLLVLMAYATTGDGETGVRRLHLVLLAFLVTWPPVWRAITGIAA